MWEYIDPQTDRMRVPEGRILRTRMFWTEGSVCCAVHQVFVQDWNHSWVIEKIEKRINKLEGL
jgi:hypothetical protein